MLREIRNRQLEFQKAVNLPVDSMKEDDILRMSELYVFKAIEELIELRKEFPSFMNPHSKDQKTIDKTRIYEEFADVMLFLYNFANLWKMSDVDILETMMYVQDRNFKILKEKKMNQFNETITNTPGYTVAVGSGTLNPQYVFIGQNPGEGITNGYKAWSNPTDGSSQILLPILKELGIDDKCYFTNVVKCTTPGNKEPDQDLTDFWLPRLEEELNILKIGNPNYRIISMGNYAKRTLRPLRTVSHPAFVLRGGMSRESYKKEIDHAINDQ